MITEYGGWTVGDKAMTSAGVVEIVAFAVSDKKTRAACVTGSLSQWFGLLLLECLQPYVKPIEVGDRVIDSVMPKAVGIVRHIEGGEAVAWYGDELGLMISDVANLRHATN